MPKINCEKLARDLARMRKKRVEVALCCAELIEKGRSPGLSLSINLKAARALRQSTDELIFLSVGLLLETEDENYTRIIKYLRLKTVRDKELSFEELDFIYNMDFEKFQSRQEESLDKIHNSNELFYREYERLIAQRNLLADGVRLYNVSSSEVARTHAEISDQTRVYMGMDQYEVIRPHEWADVLRLSKVKRLRTDTTDMYLEFKAKITDWAGTIVDYCSSVVSYDNLRALAGDFIAEQANIVSLLNLEEMGGRLSVYAKKSLLVEKLKRAGAIHSESSEFVAPQLTAVDKDIRVTAKKVLLPTLQKTMAIWADEATEISAESLRESEIVSALRARKLYMPNLDRVNQIYLTRTTATTVKEIVLTQASKKKIIWQPEE